MTQEEVIKKSKEICQNTMMEHLGIEYTEVGTDYVKAKMPVDHRTHQPMGLLHGGATAALIESLGSMGSHVFLKDQNQSAVGLEINVNHLKGVKQGWVFAKGTLVHRGSRTHVWQVDVTNEDNQLVATGRLTNMIIQL